MSLQACADIVSRGDPDRFAAAMAAPVAARRVLFPLYAFNIEVARAPWVTAEPMIGEMRLQWWRDVLEEIGETRTVRRHEVTTPLAEVLDSAAVRSLDRLITARRWDLYKDAFEDKAHFDAYIAETGGTLMWAAAHALGAPPESEAALRAFGTATGLVRFLAAVPELEGRGRIPLVDGRPDAISALAEQALRSIADSRKLRASLPPAARPALLEGWQTRPLLKQITKSPGRVATGQIGLSPFRKKLTLLLQA